MDKQTLSRARQIVDEVSAGAERRASLSRDIRVGMDSKGHYYVRHDNVEWAGLSGDEAVSRLVQEVTR